MMAAKVKGEVGTAMAKERAAGEEKGTRSRRTSRVAVTVAGNIEGKNVCVR